MAYSPEGPLQFSYVFNHFQESERAAGALCVRLILGGGAAAQASSLTGIGYEDGGCFNTYEPGTCAGIGVTAIGAIDNPFLNTDIAHFKGSFGGTGRLLSV